MKLKDKTVLLTGASGGIGLELSDLLKKAGANVKTVGRKDGNDYVADLSDPIQLSSLCQKIARDDIDIIINSAGLQYFGFTHEQDPQSVSNILKTNVEAPIRLIQALIPNMLKKGSGHIVNIGSVFGYIPFPHFSVYSATKAAMGAFSQSIRREYADKGIKVTHISPRAVKTNMNSGPIIELLKETKSQIDSPEKVAKKIIKAIEADKKSITIGFPEKLFVKISMIAPSIIDNALAKNIKIAEDILKKHKA